MERRKIVLAAAIATIALFLASQAMAATVTPVLTNKSLTKYEYESGFKLSKKTLFEEVFNRLGQFLFKRTTASTYSRDGKLLSVSSQKQDKNNKVIMDSLATNGYDKKGNMTKVQGVENYYDSKGKLAFKITYDASYKYNSKNILISFRSEEKGINQATGAVTFSYTAARDYNDFGRLVSEVKTNAENGVTRYIYDAKYNYAGAQLLGSVIKEQGFGANGALLRDYLYTDKYYYAGGRLNFIEGSTYINGRLDNNFFTKLEYDAKTGRLSKTTRTGQRFNAKGELIDRTITVYGYDKYTRLVSIDEQTFAKGTTLAKEINVTYGYDNKGRLIDQKNLAKYYNDGKLTAKTLYSLKRDYAASGAILSEVVENSRNDVLLTANITKYEYTNGNRLLGVTNEVANFKADGQLYSYRYTGSLNKYGKNNLLLGTAKNVYNVYNTAGLTLEEIRKFVSELAQKDLEEALGSGQLKEKNININAAEIKRVEPILIVPNMAGEEKVGRGPFGP